MCTKLILLILLIPISVFAQVIGPDQCCECAVGLGTGCKDSTTNMGATCQPSLIIGASLPCNVSSNSVCIGLHCVTFTPTNTPSPTRTFTPTPTTTFTPGVNCGMFPTTANSESLIGNDCQTSPSLFCMDTSFNNLFLERDQCGPLDYQQQAIVSADTSGQIPMGSTITSGFIRISSADSHTDDNVNIQGEWIGGSPTGCNTADFNYNAGHAALNTSLASVCPSDCCPFPACVDAQSIDLPLGDLGSIVNVQHPKIRLTLGATTIAGGNNMDITSYGGDHTFGNGPQVSFGYCWIPPATDTPGGTFSPTRTPTPTFTKTRTPTPTFTTSPTPTLTSTCPAIAVRSPLPSPIPADCNFDQIVLDRTIPFGNWIVPALSSDHIVGLGDDRHFATLSITDTKSNSYGCECNLPNDEGVGPPAGGSPIPFPLASCICYSDLSTQLTNTDIITVHHDTDCNLIIWSLELTDAPCSLTTTPPVGFGECILNMHRDSCYPDQAPYNPGFCSGPFPPGTGCGHPGCVICCTPSFGSMLFAPFGKPAFYEDHGFFLTPSERHPCNVAANTVCGDLGSNSPTNWQCCPQDSNVSLCTSTGAVLGCFNNAASQLFQLALEDISPDSCFPEFDARISGNFHIAVSTYNSPSVTVQWIQRTDCSTPTHYGCGGDRDSPTTNLNSAGPVSDTLGDAPWDFTGTLTSTDKKSIMKWSAPSHGPKYQGMFLPTPGIEWVERELGLFRGQPIGVPTNTPGSSPTPTTPTPTIPMRALCVPTTQPFPF